MKKKASNKNIAIIPARGGSKRLPNKNIKKLAGIPLLAYSIMYAKNSELLDEVYVTTDSEDIKNIALQYKAKVIDRPKELSGDFEPTITALKHVLQTINDDIESVVLLQPTNPFRPKNLLQEAFKVFTENNCDSLFTVTRNHHKLGKIENNKYVPFNYKIGQRSQDLEPLYFENGLLYITKAELILRDTIICKDAYPLEVNHPFAQLDIDTEDDFKYAEYIKNIDK